jgi:peptide/nickel transport system substrate-binding protein
MFLDAEKKYNPAIANSYKQIDSLTWQFDINLDYVFQNGDPLTMDDVVFSLMRLKDIPKQADIGSLIDSVTYEGNVLTVKITKANNSIIPRIITTAVIVNKAYIEANGDDAVYKNPIGTGPYKVAEFIPGTSVGIETWDGYPLSTEIHKLLTGIPEDATVILRRNRQVQYALLYLHLKWVLRQRIAN